MNKGVDFLTGARPDQAMLATPENFIKGTTPVEYDADSPAQIYKENFSDIKMNGKFYTNKGGGRAFSEENGLLKLTNSDGTTENALAITKARIWSRGQRNDIYFGKAAFSSKEQLTSTLAHELGHVIHNNLGLASLAGEMWKNVGLSQTPFESSLGHLAIGKMQAELFILNGWQKLGLNSPFTHASYYNGGYGNTKLYEVIKHLSRRIK